MCARESWVSSEALSGSAVSKIKVCASVHACADYGTVKVEPPTPSPVRHKYSSALAHMLRWTNSLLKYGSQAEGTMGGVEGGRNVREKGKKMGVAWWRN